MSVAFSTPIDIANRALQHCGARRIVAFDDDSKNAAAVSFCYDKLREAELRRNVWKFATRRAALRAIDDDSRLVTLPAWAIGTTYGVNAIVTFDGLAYYSTITANLGNSPDSSTAWSLYFGPLMASLYDVGTTYYAGEIVYVSTVAYLSLVSANDTTPPGASWRTLTSATLAPLNLIYPLGSGPSSQCGTNNIYRLPNGFLREANQNPRTGAAGFLGVSTAAWPSDWIREGDYILTGDTGVIVFRFVANIADVPEMDPMFCEGLSARIALEVCEEVTQSAEKLNTIGAKYKLFMNEARQVNGIEVGPEFPPEDDWITARR